ncbi:MAG TPA: BON domain-containing protein, partial [Verrucomicrobiae bacterium]|nr:BON domain-containing protein [Verrucomicrobiae bacterium]
MRNLKKLVMTGGMTAAVAVMALTGCKMMENSHSGGRTAGRVLDDKTITAKVNEKLEKEPVYKFSNVDVKTFDGIVQLSGFVDTNDQKQRAAELAQSVDGVTRVVNNITMKPQINQSQMA